MANEVPSYLTTMTEDQIRQRMQDNISDDYDKTEGGFIRDIGVDPLAVELAYMAFVAQETRRRGFASTVASTVSGEVTGELTMRASEHGVDRKAAEAATGIVTVSGTSGTQIWKGFRFGTLASGSTAPVVFTADGVYDVGAGGTVDVPVTAQVAGRSENVAAGKVVMMIDRQDGLTGVTNAAAMSGGADIEDDVALLPRYLAKVRSPSTGGNKADYENWAMEVSGVGGVSVIPLRDGDGTVSIAIIGTDKKPADAATVTAAQNHIDDQAPIGAQPTVEAATQVIIDISATITIAIGYDAATVKANATTAVDNYIQGQAFNKTDNDIRYAKVGDAILNTDGVIDLDYSTLLINGGTTNITIGAQEVAVTGTVTLT